MGGGDALERLTIDDNLNAFCKDTDAYLEGATDGPLSGLTFAAKDILDVAGYVTGGGNPDWKSTHGPAERTAWVVGAGKEDCTQGQEGRAGHGSEGYPPGQESGQAGRQEGEAAD